MMRIKTTLLTLLSISFFCFSAGAQVYFPSVHQPSSASMTLTDNGILSVNNNILSVRFTIQQDHFKEAQFTNRLSHQSLVLEAAQLFNIKLKDGTTLDADDFEIVRHGEVTQKRPRLASLRGVDQLASQEIRYVLRSRPNDIQLVWTLSLHDSCNFIEQNFHFTQDESADAVETLSLVRIPLTAQPDSVGEVDGLPLVVNNMFLGMEHPMTFTQINDQSLESSLGASVAMRKGKGFDVKVAWGVTPENQLRRGYLYYLEKIRAVPYRPFLHYNSWYDLSWVDRHLHAADCIDRVKTYIDSLIIKRRVDLKAFLWDDGWDDSHTLWKFNKDMPNGFSTMNQLLKPFDAQMGVWISPWGGYGQTKANRIESSKNHVPPLGTNDHGFSMADSNYFNFFTATAANFIKKRNVAIFKFDGVGAGNGAAGATKDFQKDIEGLLRATKKLRKIKPDIYLSLTVGTWPSPYWLKFGDNIWRSGGDFGYAGKGNKREQWLNYRDEKVYENVVERSRLFPLNAVMNHGIGIAKNGYVKVLPNDYQSLSEGIWSFFGDGTSLQELYVDPHMLNGREWDLLAKAIRWSHRHKGILADVHWVGGNPKDQVYGYAAWNPTGGTLMLRNPTNREQTFRFSLEEALELPPSFNGKYALYNVMTDKGEGVYSSTKEIQITLQPQEVKVMNVEKE